IRKSSNIGTAKIAIMMGEQRLYRTLCKFGLGNYTGISLPSENLGVLKPPNQWDGLSVSRFGFGYGVNCTPVQMARAYCALANRGNLPKLRLIDRTYDPDKGEFKEMPYEKSQVIYSPEVGEQIVNMMVAVTEEGGTARQAAIPGYRVAGKTGTAYRHIPGQGYSNKQRYTSFVGFVPAEKPAFVLLITLDSAVHPEGRKTFGGGVAGPVWKAIAVRTLKYMNIPPTVPEKNADQR
ncbi:MAG: penicillin-binding protein, partial [Lentisphaeria bacterium]|nr:penicillin-binding protein [Lentisphaeria bacterium]